MRLSCDYKLDNYRVQAMIENPKGMLESVERQVKSNIAHEVAKMVEVKQIPSDPEIPMVSVEELAKIAVKTEYSPFGYFPEDMRPRYHAEIYVFTQEQIDSIVESLRVGLMAASSGDAYGAEEAIKSAGRALTQ